MKVVMIGTGYVGLVSGTCFAELGHDVTCIDIDTNKVEKLKQGISPIYEPGLTDLLKRNFLAKRLDFSSDYEAVASAKSIFLAVGTPSAENGEADLTYLFKAAEMVAKKISDGAIIVIKSTVPVGTCEKVQKILAENTKKEFHVVNNPEFLKEGSAVDDFMRPDRVVIGSQNDYARSVMDELYAPLVRQGNPIIHMSNVSAEMTKYAANCFLAAKISFINEIARLCDATDSDIEEVRKGIMSDRRIGHHFLYPGPGYGGSCFPKDVKALLNTAKENDVKLHVVNAAEEVNKTQKTYMFSKIHKYFKGNLSGKVFAFWGVAFKPNTDDIRESPAIYMAKALLEEGATIKFHDPVASENFLKFMGESNREKLQSIEPICDEIVINVGFEDPNLKKDDGTYEYLRDHLNHSKYRFIKSHWDVNQDQRGLILSKQTNLALAECKGKIGQYIQSDEILHEQDYSTIHNSILDLANTPQLMGLVYNYIHFYGNVDVIKKTRNIYRREVRTIKLGKNLHSHLDAQGFRTHSGDKIVAKLIDAHVYHYGWARAEKIMAKKVAQMEKLYHGKNYTQAKEFTYERIWGLKPFTGTHPLIMQNWIQEHKNDMDIMNMPLRFEWKNFGLIISDFIEDITGLRMGEYKGYRRLKG